MFVHRAQRLLTAGLAALALTGLTIPPAAASYDECSPTDAFNGFTMYTCMTISQGTNPWQYVGFTSYDGDSRNWSSCTFQLRLFHGASANVQVRYHSGSCAVVIADPDTLYRLDGYPPFCPQPGNSYKAKWRLVGVLNGQSVSHEVSTPVVPWTAGTGTCQTTGGVAPALPDLPGVLVPAV